MKAQEEKDYRKLVEALRKSEPDTGSTSGIEMAVMEAIAQKKAKLTTGERISEFLFGWMDVPWVRRSLIAASFALLGFFVWQQNDIIRQINDLNLSLKNNNRMIRYDPSAAMEKRQSLIRFSRDRSRGYYVQEEDLLRLVDSLNLMNIRYRKLMEILNDNPELKKNVEEQFDKNMQPRIKL
jgi:hypothetical protein